MDKQQHFVVSSNKRQQIREYGQDDGRRKRDFGKDIFS